MTAALFTTLERLKRRAKRLKKETGCTHTQALDQVAQAGGYQNFTHARRTLDDSGTIAQLSGGQTGHPKVTRVSIAKLRNRNYSRDLS